MSDQPWREPARHAGGDPDEQVRRLLADARHTGPVPDDVAARIDAALAAETASPAGTTPVARHAGDELADRRRRRTRSGLLAAAAVVVVAGVGLGAAGLLDGGGEEATTSSDVTAGSDAESGSEPPTGAVPDAGRTEQDRGGGPGTPDGREGPLQRFSAEAQPGAPLVREGPTLLADLAAALESDPLPGPASGTCTPADLPGERFGVRFDDGPAQVVAGPVADAERRVALYACGAGDAPITRSPVLSATVPVD